MRRLTLVLLATIGGLAACKQGEGDRCQVQGDCEDGLVCNRSTNSCQEIAGGFDGQIAPDAAVDAGPQIDAPIDAVPSTVTVTDGDCNPAVPANRQLTTNTTPAFVLSSGTLGENPNLSLDISSDDNRLQFSTTGLHNFASDPATPAMFRFRSGDPGVHTGVCVEFTAAATIDYLCEMHPTLMMGTITVNP